MATAHCTAKFFWSGPISVTGIHFDPWLAS